MYGIILAGGSGSRLWPLSRELYPKQLLNLISDKSLLQSTFERLTNCMQKDEILSITNTKHSANVRMQLAQQTENPKVLSEPVSKNTAPAIALATKYIMQETGEDPVILVVPSDHLIQDKEHFLSTVKKGEKLAEEGYIVTFGIKPNYPETGYGYINTLKPLDIGFKVKEFVEKPNLETAEKYLKAGTYYWNSGIFMFKASTMIAEIEKNAPEIAKIAQNVDFTKSSDIPFVEFDKMPSISIDYAVMEKSDKIALVALESDWNDLGSWQSIYDVSKKDENNNVFIGHVIDEGSKNSFIHVNSGQKLSVQSHNHRSEHWVVLTGTAKVVLEANERILSPGHSVDIPVKAIHSLQNPYKEALEIIEVQKGDIIAEDDIIRYEDIYGRV